MIKGFYVYTNIIVRLHRLNWETVSTLFFFLRLTIFQTDANNKNADYDLLVYTCCVYMAALLQ